MWLLTLGSINLGIRLLGTDLVGGELIRRTKQKTSNILY